MDLFTGHALSLLNLGASVLYTALGVYVLLLDRHARLNIIISLTCAAFAVWAFSFSMMNSTRDMAAVNNWYDISAIGWCLFSGLALHFMYRLPGSSDRKIPWYLLLIFYTPGLAFFLVEFTGILAARDFRFIHGGYAEVPPMDSPLYWAFLLYQAGYLIVALVILLRWRSSAKLKREKKQARTMFLVGSLSLVLCSAADILLPALDVFRLPAISSVLILVWAWGMVFAIRRYRLMTMTLNYASRHIVEVMNEMLILLDHHGRIDAINRKAEWILGMPLEKIRNSAMEELVVEREVLREGISAVLERRRKDVQITVNIIIGNGDIVPFSLEASAHEDRFGDIMGVIITGHDISDKVQLVDEIKARRSVEEALRLSEKDLIARNEIIGQGLRDAMVLQKTMLPGGRAPGAAGLISYLYEPMEDVGGDFCDFVRLGGDDRVGIFISDVSGHGVKAAFITAMLKTIVIQAGSRAEDPSEMLAYVNDVLHERTGGCIVTAFYGIYTAGDRRLLYSSAGHNPPYLVRRGAVSELECGHSLPLAVMAGGKLAQYGKQYANRGASLEAGDKVLIYTDGLSEARSAGDPGKLFIAHGLAGALREHSREPGERFLAGVLEAARRFHGVAAFEDDVCMICLDVR